MVRTSCTIITLKSSQNSTGSSPHAVIYNLLCSHTKHVHGSSAERFPWWCPSSRLQCISSKHIHEIKCHDVFAMTVRYEAIKMSFRSPPTAPFTIFNAPLRSTLNRFMRSSAHGGCMLDSKSCLEQPHILSALLLADGMLKDV